MRPLLITENHPPDRGGMAESCDRIVRGLVARGVAVDLLHFDRKAVRPHLQRSANGTLVRWPLGDSMPHAVNTAWHRVQRELDLEATTHVLAFGGAAPIAAAPVFAAWIDRPLVTMIRGNELDAGLFDPRRRPLLDEAFARSAAIACVTTEQAAKIAALHPHANLQTIANGIDFDTWQATASDHARAASYATSSKRTLGLIGHLKAKKGAQFLIEVLRASGLDSRFELLLAGEADFDVPIAATRIATVDRFELIPIYLACDFVVLPSHYDGFPNVLIEAAALGRPILASNVGGMRDLLTDGVDALLFDPGDEHECRRALTRAASMTPDAIRAMGERAQRTARERCDAADEARRYEELLHATARTESIRRRS